MTIAPRARVTAFPGQLIADGASKAELTIEMLDINGNVVTDTVNPVITATLGALTGSGGPQNGVLTRTLQASTTVGLAQIYVDGTVAEGSVPMVAGTPAMAAVVAAPSVLPADGVSTSSLTISLFDDYGHSLTSTGALTVSASHSQIIGCQAASTWPATCALSATTSPGLAAISVGGLVITGDAYIHFLDMNGGLLNGGFEATGLTGWAAGNTVLPAGGSLALPDLYYQTTLLAGDTVDGIGVLPLEGSRMVRLGATTADNTAHQISEAWVSQPVYVPADTVTQLSFRYRILSYDLAIGSENNGFQEYDPFEVYIDGQEKFQDGLIYSDEWYYGWYTQNPSAPQDLGWRRKVLDLTPYAGQVVNLEFRMSNRAYAVDNTWLYLDNVAVGPMLHAAITVDAPGRVRRPQTAAQVPVLRSNGTDTATLTINIKDDFGHVLPTSRPLTVTTSHSALPGCAGVQTWPATCVLSATKTAGKAVFSIEGWDITGDATVYFAGDVRDNDFEVAALDNWFAGKVITLTGAADLPPYTVTLKSSDTVDGIAVTPPGGSGMVRLGATDDQNLLYNQPHQTSEVSIWQPIYIPPGTTQLSFMYRLLSYDVALGAYGEYDPFEVYINGQEVWQAGYEWSAAWQTWYESGPTMPKDMGWQTAYLGLSQHGGEIVTLEFRVSNRRAAIDDTWVYLDRLQLTNVPVYYVYMPLVQK